MSGGLPPAAMSVTGNGVTIANGDNTPSVGDDTDFGTTTNGTQVSKTFTILDTGGQSITGISVAVSGNFTITVQPSATIAGGANSTFTVRATAATNETATGTVTISSSLANYTFAVQCIVQSTLLNGLQFYYKMEETSGSRASEVNSLTLTDNNTVTSNTGKVNTAAEFTRVNTEYLSSADNVNFRGGDNDYTIAFWAYTTLPTTVQEFMGKAQSTVASGIDWRLFNNSGVFFHVSDGTNIVSRSSTTLTANTWYFVFVYHDSVNNKIGFSLNNAVPSETAFTANPAHVLSSAPFRIGANGSAAATLDGRIDEVGKWNRVLTSTERGQLYNSGNGVTYPF